MRSGPVKLDQAENAYFFSYLRLFSKAPDFVSAVPTCGECWRQVHRTSNALASLRHAAVMHSRRQAMAHPERRPFAAL